MRPLAKLAPGKLGGRKIFQESVAIAGRPTHSNFRRSDIAHSKKSLRATEAVLHGHGLFFFFVWRVADRERTTQSSSEWWRRRRRRRHNLQSHILVFLSQRFVSLFRDVNPPPRARARSMTEAVAAAETIANQTAPPTEPATGVTALPLAVLGKCASYLSLGDYFWFRAVDRRFRAASELRTATPAVLAISSLRVVSPRLPAVVRNMQPRAFRCSPRSSYSARALHQAVAFFGASLTDLEVALAEPYRPRYRKWLPALTQLRRLCIRRVSRISDRSDPYGVFEWYDMPVIRHDCRFVCASPFLVDLTLPCIASVDLAALASVARLERLALWSRAINTATTTMAEDDAPSKRDHGFMAAVGLHPLRELVVESHHLDGDDVRQLMAHLPTLESLVATWTLQRALVNRLSDTADTAAPLVTLLANRLAATTRVAAAATKTVNGERKSPTVKIAFPATLTRVATRIFEPSVFADIARRMVHTLRVLRLEFVSGNGHWAAVQLQLSTLEALHTLEIAAEGLDVRHLAPQGETVQTLVRRNLRVFRFANRPLGSQAFAWSDDPLAAILEYGRRLPESVVATAAAAAAAATTTTTTVDDADNAVRGRGNGVVADPPTPPGLWVLDLRYCEKIGMRLRHLLAEEAPTSSFPSSSSFSSSSSPLSPSPPAVCCSATLRDLGIPPLGVREDPRVDGFRPTVLRLEATAVYTDEQWRRFVALPTVRHVTVREAPPKPWADEWRARGTSVSVVGFE